MEREQRAQMLRDEMLAIFERHGVNPYNGDESFWNAVEDVQVKNKKDAISLETRADAFMNILEITTMWRWKERV